MAVYTPKIPRIRAIQALVNTDEILKGKFYLSAVSRAEEHIKAGRARRVKAADISDEYLEQEQG